MTQVSVSKRCGTYTVRLDGHAGYAAAGQDVVCAGISTLAFTLIRALEDMKIHVDKRVMDQAAGTIEVSFPAGKRTEPVLSTILSGFEMMRQQYPKHIQIGWAK